MAVVYSKVLLFDPPLIYTAPDTCVFGAVLFIRWTKGRRQNSVPLTTNFSQNVTEPSQGITKLVIFADMSQN